MGNEHGHPKDIAGETRQTFTSSADTAFDVCLENTLVSQRTSLPVPSPSPSPIPRLICTRNTNEKSR